MDTCYVDTETTSLRNPHLFDGRRVWEVALIRVPAAGGAVRAEWLQIIDVDLAGASSESLRIGRFHERFSRNELRGEITPAEIDGETQLRWQQVPNGTGWRGGNQAQLDVPRTIRLRGVAEAEAAAVIEELTRGAVLAGSNPGFDIENFTEMLYRHGQPVDGWYHHPRDVPNVATGWLRAQYELQAKVGEHERGDGWVGESYSTGTLSEACGVPVPLDRHSAWADAVWMWRWDRQLRGIELPDNRPRHNETAPVTVPG